MMPLRHHQPSLSGASRFRSILRLATCPHRCWPLGSSRRLHQQGRDRHMESCRERLQRRDRHVLRSSLDPAHIGTIHPSRERQALLGQSTGNPVVPQVPADDLDRSHDRSR